MGLWSQQQVLLFVFVESWAKPCGYELVCFTSNSKIFHFCNDGPNWGGRKPPRTSGKAPVTRSLLENRYHKTIVSKFHFIFWLKSVVPFPGCLTALIHTRESLCRCLESGNQPLVSAHKVQMNRTDYLLSFCRGPRWWQHQAGVASQGREVTSLVVYRYRYQYKWKK